MTTKKKQSKPSVPSVEEILESGDIADIRALFAFDNSTSEEDILVKFNLWGRWFFTKFYKTQDAPFHKLIDTYNLRVYLGDVTAATYLKFFVDIAFRGAAKTTRTKLFVAFVCANDMDHRRRFFKVLSADRGNAVQIVTDVYNMLINQKVLFYYPEIFRKTAEKRQESMSVFTTATGVKMLADTVGTDQRGDIQEDVRPDFIWFDDFETRKTLRSAVTTQAIWDNMEEAKNGLAKDGGAIYNCNYLSERGNVHKLVVMESNDRMALITPIIQDGKPTWSAAYTSEEIQTIESNADDFAGEFLCEPSAGADIYFDRAVLEKQDLPTPIKEIAGRKIYANYNPAHRYGTGSDVGGGVGLDHSADVTIDFSTLPARVVSTFKSNTLKPDVYGHELLEQGRRYGECLLGPENNKFDTVIQVLRQNDYPNIYFTEVPSKKAGMPPKTRTYGWNTNGATKYSMLAELKSAVEDGHLQLSDPDLIAELRSYTRDDLMDRDEDVRLTTRHFDLLIACAIAWQMRKYAAPASQKTGGYQQPAYESPLLE